MYIHACISVIFVIHTLCYVRLCYTPVRAFAIFGVLNKPIHSFIHSLIHAFIDSLISLIGARTRSASITHRTLVYIYIYVQGTNISLLYRYYIIVILHHTTIVWSCQIYTYDSSPSIQYVYPNALCPSVFPDHLRYIT